MNKPQLFNIDIEHARALGDLVEAVYPQGHASQRRGHGVLTYLGPTTTSTEHIRLSEATMVAIVSGALVDDPDLSTKYVHLVDHIGIEYHVSVPDVIEALIGGRARIGGSPSPDIAEVTVKLFVRPGRRGVSSRVYDRDGILRYGHDSSHDHVGARDALLSLARSGPTTRFIDNQLHVATQPSVPGKRSVTVEVFTETGKKGAGARVYDERGALQCRIEPSEGTDAQQALRHLSESAIVTRYINEHLTVTIGHR